MLRSMCNRVECMAVIFEVKHFVNLFRCERNTRTTDLPALLPEVLEAQPNNKTERSMPVVKPSSV